jgi:hypothetical protein
MVGVLAHPHHFPAMLVRVAEGVERGLGHSAVPLTSRDRA